MSGGYFDIPLWKLKDMCESINSYIYGIELDEESKEYLIGQQNWNYSDLSKEDIEYIKENSRTRPNKNEYEQVTIDLLKDAVRAIKTASVYINRVDYLFDCDDSEESFKRRLEEELKKIKTEDKND